jgi:DtxR family Mn-dependent transcriptional regulator
MQTFCGITTDGMLDYLAAIYKLGETQARGSDKVTTSALAEMMHVSPAAASSMLKRLEESNFAERSNVDGITLTEQGRLAALQLIRRHRLLEVFLVQVMGFTWDQVDLEAHRLEHSISSSFEDRIDTLCGFPTHCPHGDPIPQKDGTLPAETLLSVLDLQPGQAGTLRRVGTNDARVLRYLTQLALEPGCALRLVDLAPFNGPVTLELLEGPHGDSTAATKMLGSELAAQLYVRPHAREYSAEYTAPMRAGSNA